MRRSLLVAVGAVALMTFALGCGKKGEAIAALDKVDAACTAKDDAGAKTALDEAQKNSLFKKHFDLSTDKIPDKSQVAPCGRLWRSELRTRLENLGIFAS